MQKVLLLHNPGAGDEDHIKSDLVKAIEKEGFECVYYSTKENSSWTAQLNRADVAVVAGGDGTVRTVVRELMSRTLLDKKIPLALLPMGTANNLSKALGIDPKLRLETHIKSWKGSQRQRFDVGKLQIGAQTDFFLESAGFGVFPNLIKKMKTVDKSSVESAQDEMKLALEVLHEIILTTPSEEYHITADDRIYEGKMILLEVMNIQSLGPNIVLAPEAEIDDGFLDFVCVEEDQRYMFADYIKKLIADDDAVFEWRSVKAKELRINCESVHFHFDDELLSPLQRSLLFEARANMLEFLTYNSMS